MNVSVVMVLALAEFFNSGIVVPYMHAKRILCQRQGLLIEHRVYAVRGLYRQFPVG